MSERGSLMRAVGSISLATFFSRILGLLRDQVQSYYFGAGLVTDAFLAAFRIPNLLRDLFAEGALSSAFVPTFTMEREKHGAAAAFRLANRVFTVLAVILGIVTLALFAFAPWILHLYAGGFTPAKFALALTMTRILSPFLLFVALAAVAMGVLNTCGRFFLPALAPAWFNVAAIVGVIALVPVFRATGISPGVSLAVGAIVGGALQFLVQVPALRREGFSFHPELAWSDPGVRRIASLMLPATFGLAATQLNLLVDTILASYLADGTITWLSLAFRLMQLPIGLFGVAIATANLTRVSRNVAGGDTDGLRANLAGSLRAAALLTIPASAGLIALREPIVRLLFEHGRFTPEATLKTAAAVLCYSLGLYAYAVVKIQVPTFYALGDTRTPVIASACAIGLKIGANFLLLAVLPMLGMDPFLALALTTALAAWTNFALLSRGLRARLGPLGDGSVLRVSAALVVLSGIMGFACSAAFAVLVRLLPGGGLAGEIGRLACVVVLGMAITGLGAHWIDFPEARALIGRLARFARPKRSA